MKSHSNGFTYTLEFSVSDEMTTAAKEVQECIYRALCRADEHGVLVRIVQLSVVWGSDYFLCPRSACLSLEAQYLYRGLTVHLHIPNHQHWQELPVYRSSPC